MKKRTTLALLLAVSVLIFDSRTAVESAREALCLCGRVLIPSLFPLLVLSQMLVPGLAGMTIPGLNRLLGFPEGFFLLGSLGGYPLGAACIAHSAGRGELSREDAARMMGLCSLCGPGFLFGIVGGLLSLRDAALIFGIQLEAALFIATFWPGIQKGSCQPSLDPPSISDAVNRAVNTVLTVSGWVILAAVAAGFLRRWLFPLLPDGAAVVLTGLLELTNGIYALQSVNREAQLVLCALFVSFGGISVLLQIAGLSEGIGMGQCIAQKTVHGLLAMALAFLCLRLGNIALFLIPVLLFAKIAVEIPLHMVYNVCRKEGI